MLSSKSFEVYRGYKQDKKAVMRAKSGIKALANRIKGNSKYVRSKRVACENLGTSGIKTDREWKGMVLVQANRISLDWYLFTTAGKKD